MEHIFLLCAAKPHSRAVIQLVARIRTAAAQTGSLCLIRECRRAGDIEAFICRDAARGGAMRFYVYGSDADLCAAARVASGFSNAEIGIIPDARGCDFARSYPHADFSSPLAQLRAAPRTVDMIDCNGQRFLNSVRVCSPGTFRRAVPLSPPVSLAAACDDGALLTGAFVSAAVGNGTHSGRKNLFRYADPSDGRLDFALQRSLPPRGTTASIQKQVRRLTLVPHQPLYVCGDGQQFRAIRLSFTAVPGCVRFLIPAARTHHIPIQFT
ncbi:hypothetical protein [Butyricicoccus sp.]|uniref:hypothetical protein n=1 Tax=Butyricicoccus sp. TaxID=2049021 RepID=UPI003F13CA62